MENIEDNKLQVEKEKLQWEKERMRLAQEFEKKKQERAYELKKKKLEAAHKLEKTTAKMQLVHTLASKWMLYRSHGFSLIYPLHIDYEQK